MKIRTSIARIAFVAVVTVALGGCTVSRNQYLDTAYGPGAAPSTYRVGGLREVTEVGSKVTIIRRADVESGWTGEIAQPAATQPASN